MASQIIPPGYSKITFTWTLTGSARFFQSSVEVQNLLTDGNPTSLLATVRSAFVSTGRPFTATNMFTGYVITDTKILMHTLGGILLTANNTTPVTGSKSGAPLPVNTSVIVRKSVAQAGKKYRGRMLVPPLYFSETDVDAVGNIGAPLATYQTAWTGAWTDLNPSTPIVLLHSDPLITPTPVLGLNINARIGTTGKRMRG